MTPADIQSAYALPTGSQGSGLTVAIVDAFDLPTAEADLAFYRSSFGLPPCTTDNGCFSKVNQSGNEGPYPVADAGWGFEIALDLDMVSAACPNCNILLVEANTNANSDLGAAVNTAVALGAMAVSNSYGAPEGFVNESYADTHYYNHPGVAITASTGDCGYNCSGQLPDNAYAAVSYPAASPYVIAVGGTTLTPAANARGWTESAWGSITDGGGAGSGCSLYEPKPAWQHDTGCAKRTQADVSAVADPSTGVLVFNNGNWYAMGGTSAASPIIAATFALAGRPPANAYPASYLYGNTAALNDVVGGNNVVTNQVCTVTYLCNGVAGYDGPTGLGTPNGVGAFAAPTAPGKPTNVVAVAGNATAGLTWTAPADNGSPISSYTVTSSPDAKTCSASATSCTFSGLTNGQPYTFTVTATNGMGTGPASDPSSSITVSLIGATYHALTPARVLDSRDGYWIGLAGAFSSHVARTFQVSGHGGVPANAIAVTGNLTVTAQTSLGYLYIGPDAVNDPTSSTLNFPVGDDRANAVTIALGVGGTLSATYAAPTSGETAQVIFDVTGYFTPDASGATYHALTPARVLDSRDGYWIGLAGAFSSHVARTFQVSGRGGVPANATAVTGNLTVTAQTSLGYLYIGPDAVNDPTSSTLNFPLGDDRANAVTLALGAGGTLSVTFAAPTLGPTAQVIFDVTGYFTPDGSGAKYVPLTPSRVLDSRDGYWIGLAGAFSSHVARTFQVSGHGGVPANAIAVTGNLTVTAQTSLGYLFIGPVGMNNPTSSTLNFPLGDDRANATTVALGAGGTLSPTYAAPTTGPTAQVIFDVTGYFVQ